MNRKGYTLIEMLLVFSIVMVVMMLSTPLINQKYTWSSVIINEIYATIEQCRQDAITDHQEMTLTFDNHDIEINGYPIYHHPSLCFSTPESIDFNEKGHISNPKTIHFKINHKQYILVFNLGYGAYYVKAA